MNRRSLCLLLPLILFACTHSRRNATDISPPLEHQDDSRGSAAAEAAAGDLEYFIGSARAPGIVPPTLPGAIRTSTR